MNKSILIYKNAHTVINGRISHDCSTYIFFGMFSL